MLTIEMINERLQNTTKRFEEERQKFVTMISQRDELNLNIRNAELLLNSLNGQMNAYKDLMINYQHGRENPSVERVVSTGPKPIVKAVEEDEQPAKKMSQEEILEKARKAGVLIDRSKRVKTDQVSADEFRKQLNDGDDAEVDEVPKEESPIGMRDKKNQPVMINKEDE